MKSFEPGFIEAQPITQNLLQTIRLIGEYSCKDVRVVRNGGWTLRLSSVLSNPNFKVNPLARSRRFSAEALTTNPNF